MHVIARLAEDCLLHNEELSGLNSSPNIMRVIKSRRMKWAWHVPRPGVGEVYTGFWWGNVKEKDHLEDVDGKIILNGSSRSGMVGWGA